MEDNDYLGDLGYTKGVDYDLDENNGRYCVTPEFPNGTYAYFVAIDANGTPLFPYNIGRGFYGSPTGGAVAGISEIVTTNFIGGASSTLKLNAPAVANGMVTLVWSSVEGGTYQVECTTNLSAWTTNLTGVVSPGVTAQTNFTSNGSQEFYRVSRTAIASY